MNNVVSITDAPSLRTSERTDELTHLEMERHRWLKAMYELVPELEDLVAQPCDRLSKPFMPIRDDAHSMLETIFEIFPELMPGEDGTPKEGF